MILVAGGTGRLGSLLTSRLLAKGEAVRVLTRDAGRAMHLPSGVEVVIGDVRDEASVIRAVAGTRIVVSAVQGFAGLGGGSPASVDRDGNKRLIDAAASVDADFILMSVVGAAADSPMELFRMKWAAETYLADSGVRATIVRATAFRELWEELLAQTAGRSGRPLVFGKGNNPINFVSVEEVAACVEHAVCDAATRGETLQIGGADDLTFNQLAASVQDAAGRTSPPRHVPPTALRFMAQTLGRVKPQLGRQARAALVMDRADLTFTRP